MPIAFRRSLVASVLAVIATVPGLRLTAQSLTLPPSGDNQKASVSQWIGPVELSISYHSPDVTAPNGEDRRGKIWGGLVPWGYANLGFGTCGDKCPWRGGANENTVFSTSDDIEVEGKALPAGSYGLHFLPGKDEWTVIFSKNSTSWGSFFYHEEEDALRVTVKPVTHPYTHWLTYEFVDRETDHATAQLQWEDLAVPIKVSVPKIDDLYVAALRRELRNSQGFSNDNWVAAAQYALDKKVDLPEALTWAEAAVSDGFVGRTNFTTLMLLGDLQEANGKTAEASATHQKGLEDPSASPQEIHNYARGLQGQGKRDEAVRVFLFNAKRFPNQWPVQVGLVRAYSAQGKYPDAIRAAKAGIAAAPNDGAKRNLQAMLEKLEKSQDVN
jgi:hypothetical protein